MSPLCVEERSRPRPAFLCRPCVLGLVLLPTVSEAFAQGTVHAAFAARGELGQRLAPLSVLNRAGLQRSGGVDVASVMLEDNAGALEASDDAPTELAASPGLSVSGQAGKAAPPAPTPAPALELDGGVNQPALDSLRQSRKLSGPLPSLNSQQTVFGAGPDSTPSEDMADDIRAHPVKLVMGMFLLFIALPIHWFNEQRSARMDTLLARGIAECVTVDSKGVDPANRGKLVHVQGRTRALGPLVDDLFADAKVDGCLKLQRTVEVYEWYMKSRMFDGRRTEAERQAANTDAGFPNFELAWTTTHHDSARFRKPSPENPRLPPGLRLGTETRTNEYVDLGGFAMPVDLVSQVRKFEVAFRRLPKILSCHGLTFIANEADGYYYARPGLASVSRSAAGTIATQARLEGLFNEPQAGDLRARFLYVPEGEATVVAVQCERAGRESFLPYRAIERSPCDGELDERERLIDEGMRPIKELRGMGGGPCCCTGGFSGCLCCPCQVISCVCTSEVTTEEIYFASEEIDPKEKPFQSVVPRNRYRVLCFRLAGVALVYMAISILLGGPFQRLHLRQLEAYGSQESFAFATLLTVAFSALIMASARVFYEPTATMQWVCIFALIVAGPVTWASVQVRQEP